MKTNHKVKHQMAAVGIVIMAEIIIISLAVLKKIQWCSKVFGQFLHEALNTEWPDIEVQWWQIMLTRIESKF